MADDAEPWILSGGRRTTHADLRGRAARAASGFASLGVREDDAVAILLGNGTPFLEASLGAILLGAQPVPVDPRAPAEHVAFVLRDCAARLAVAAADAAVPPGLPVVAAGSVEAWEGWAERYPPLDRATAAPRGTLIYTSGTTGRPKGVRRPPAPPGHRPTRALRVYGFDRPGRAVALVDGPLFHAVPNAYVRIALGAGADVVLREGFDPEATLDAVARHRVTHLSTVPSAMARLLGLPDAVRRAADTSSLVHAVHGAAPCPPHLRRAMVRWWGPVLHEYYGSTETGLLTFQTGEEALTRPGSVGRPLPGITLHILGEDGRPLPIGEVGTIYAGSDTMADFTYHGRPARRPAIGHGGLVTVGDLGRLTADGTLYLAGRAADAVRIGGRTVHPAEVEVVLWGLPGVEDCAVLGVPGSDGEDLVACATPLPGALLDPATLRHGLSGRLPPEAVPTRVVVLEALPRTESGKMVKARLRASLSV